jgi:hypothetical protein
MAASPYDEYYSQHYTQEEAPPSTDNDAYYYPPGSYTDNDAYYSPPGSYQGYAPQPQQGRSGCNTIGDNPSCGSD